MDEANDLKVGLISHLILCDYQKVIVLAGPLNTVELLLLSFMTTKEGFCNSFLASHWD